MDVYLTDLRGLSWLRDLCLARACACVYVLGRSDELLAPPGVVGRFGHLRLRWWRSVPGPDYGLAGLRCEDRIARLDVHRAGCGEFHVRVRSRCTRGLTLAHPVTEQAAGSGNKRSHVYAATGSANRFHHLKSAVHQRYIEPTWRRSTPLRMNQLE